MKSGCRPITAAATLFALLILPAGAEAYEQELDQLSREMAQKIAAANRSTLAA